MAAEAVVWDMEADPDLEAAAQEEDPVEAEVEQEVAVDMDQVRYEFKSHFDPFSFFSLF